MADGGFNAPFERLLEVYTPQMARAVLLAYGPVRDRP